MSLNTLEINDLGKLACIVIMLHKVPSSYTAMQIKKILQGGYILLSYIAIEWLVYTISLYL